MSTSSEPTTPKNAPTGSAQTGGFDAACHGRRDDAGRTRSIAFTTATTPRLSPTTGRRFALGALAGSIPGHKSSCGQEPPAEGPRHVSSCEERERWELLAGAGPGPLPFGALDAAQGHRSCGLCRGLVIRAQPPRQPMTVSPESAMAWAGHGTVESRLVRHSPRGDGPGLFPCAWTGSPSAQRNAREPWRMSAYSRSRTPGWPGSRKVVSEMAVAHLPAITF